MKYTYFWSLLGPAKTPVISCVHLKDNYSTTLLNMFHFILRNRRGMISELRMRWKRERRGKRGWHHLQFLGCLRCVPSGAERSHSILPPPQCGTEFTREDTKPTCRAKAALLSYLEAKPQ